MKAFPMLNTFRFVAATGVFIQHLEEIKFHANLSNIYNYNGIKILGGISVSAFFVLSGFLITYLLLQEKGSLNTIRVKSFYLRRILRIWPLYFMTLILYKVILINLPIESTKYIFTNSNFEFGNLQPISEVSSGLEWLLLIILLPQVLLALGKVFYPLHLWSIGVEEMFYLFWPWVLKKYHDYRKTFLIILIGYLLIYLISFLTWIYLLKIESSAAKYFQGSTFFLYCQRISCMTIGALGAEALFRKRVELLNILRHPFTSILIPIIIFLSLYKGLFFPIFVTEVYSVLFITLILQIIHWGKYFVSNPIYKICEEIGKVSFGIYMYHPFCIIISMEMFFKLGMENIYSWQLYITSFGITYGLSYLSFYFIESKILKFKNYFITTKNSIILH